MRNIIKCLLMPTVIFQLAAAIPEHAQNEEFLKGMDL